jgi:hypothetical protein
MTSKGIKRETTRGFPFDTRRVMSLLNDKQGESSKNEFTLFPAFRINTEKARF